MDIQQLNQDFGIANQLEVIAGEGGFPMIKVTNRNARALISIYGAQVLSYLPAGQTEDLFFLSPQSFYKEGKAIRGGIPVCWPWFGPDPKGLQRPNHGFVRNDYWQVAKTEALTEGETKISLLFSDTIKKEKTWRKPFSLMLEITVGATLRLKLTTTNNSDKSFSITQAFHSYFRVGHIKHVKVFGLEGCEYFDKLDQGEQKTQDGIVTVTEEVDRIYVDVVNNLIIEDPVFKRRIHINCPNTSTAVVWNPWSKTSQKMQDLGNSDYKQFICVEAGNVALDLIQIEPGQHYSLAAEYRLSLD